ncbi:MAG: septum formation initiator family protein [Solobacterium sp.]|nr:septum formation initiator family protein [Solobacterium sp.]MBQ6489889.1 septum formation initiator family protein [Solobacterium sp.]MCR5449328.1 septum formation initiator family protein [Solobacterium sp.]MDO4191803.1 septum formation initiator family protein [Erysipelotrichaceae bacterium]MDO5122466.1 septum formation initiator family protein [Erysipelotrichaceae bacterium]
MSEQKKTVKKKKKQKRKMTPFLRLICYLIIAASVFLLVEVAKEIYTTVELKKQLAEVQQKYQEVQDESAYLLQEREKLTDPDYVQSYARGNYMLSREGEQIFYLPENENK